MHSLSAIEIRRKFVEGEVSAVEIVQTFLKRIEDYDEQIGAFITVLNERALEKAKALDAKRAAGETLGKLAGVPVAIKDNMHIKGEITTCASQFLTNYRAPFSATAVDLLEAEDAIIIGKTNLDEFAMGSSTENSSLRLTHNPWNLECSPGGSSGGSAAAVAMRFCPIALGSDTGGSIRQPASFCGVVGYKPTYGRVSRFGLVAFGSSLDQIGPFTNTVEDTALVMEVLSHHCLKDSTSVAAENNHFTEQLEGDLKGVRVGVPRSFIADFPAAAKEQFDQSLRKMADAGAILVDVELNTIKHSVAVYYILATAEASTNLARFDGVRYGKRSEKAQTLDEVYDLSKEEGFGAEVKRRILLGTYVLSSGYQDAYYKKAQKVRTLMIEEYSRAFKECDVIASPVSPIPPFKLGAIQDPLEMYLADICTISANLAGLPAISVPACFDDAHLPVGFHLTGPQMQDVRLCNIAHAFEQTNALQSTIPELVS